MGAALKTGVETSGLYSSVAALGGRSLAVDETSATPRKA